MPSVTIRPLGAGDEPHRRALWDGYLEFYETVLDPGVTDVLWRRLLDAAQDPHGLCAVDESGALVGFVLYQHQRTTWLIEDCIYLEDLFVDASARRTGAGSSS